MSKQKLETSGSAARNNAVAILADALLTLLVRPCAGLRRPANVSLPRQRTADPTAPRDLRKP